MTRARSNRSGFEQRFLASMRSLEYDRGQRLTIAFSGGVDSLALALASNRIARIIQAELLLVHVDHGLRLTSAHDAAACRKLATEIGLPIEVVALEPGLAGRTIGIGLEEAARRERYLALARAATAWGSSTILLGHQANDQAETVLMHLVRGSGLDGLAGMRPSELRQVPWWTETSKHSIEITMLRPLLAETRAGIEAYVTTFGISPIVDESNATTAFDRNWVRHEVLPRLTERWPSAVESIQRSTQAMRADRELLDLLARDAYTESIRDVRTLRTEVISGLDRAIAYRVLRHWLATIEGIEIDLDAVDRLYELALSNDERRAIEVGGNQRYVVDGGMLTTLEFLTGAAAQEVPGVWGPGEAQWDVEIVQEPQPGDAILEVPVGTQLNVRSIMAGDRWSGTNRSVLEDLRKAGIHPLLRDRVLAVAAEDGVLLIPAIYPTIRNARTFGQIMKAGIRWSKRP